MKAVSIVVAICLCLLAGCASQNLANTASADTSVAGRKFEADDNFQIEAAVYGYLLEKRPWGDGDYAAIFLEGDDARVAALIRKFPHSVTPLKPSSRAELVADHAPIYKETGKPGLLLSAKAVDPTNDVSEAIGNWNGGPPAIGVSAFVLIKVDGAWTVQSAQ